MTFSEKYKLRLEKFNQERLEKKKEQDAKGLLPFKNWARKNKQKKDKELDKKIENWNLEDGQPAKTKYLLSEKSVKAIEATKKLLKQNGTISSK